MHRIERLPTIALPAGLRAGVAGTRRARLIGLALAAAPPPRVGLLIPRCRSVHTFGMRRPLDVVFLDGRGRIVRIATAVPPRRIAWCAGAAAVIETRAGEGERFALALQA